MLRARLPAAPRVAPCILGLWAPQQGAPPPSPSHPAESTDGTEKGAVWLLGTWQRPKVPVTAPLLWAGHQAAGQVAWAGLLAYPPQQGAAPALFVA